MSLPDLIRERRPDLNARAVEELAAELETRIKRFYPGPRLVAEQCPRCRSTIREPQRHCLCG